MDIDQEHDNLVTSNAMVEESKRKCEAVMDTIETLTNLSLSCRHTLLRLIHSELSFLSRVSFSDFTTESEPSICVNIGHLESVVYILQQPNIFGVSRVCKTVPFQPLTQNGTHNTALQGAHVDIVCTFDGNPVWIIVSDRNPKYLSWDGQQESSKNKGLRARAQLLLEIAHNSTALKPTSLIFFFSNGLNRFTREKFRSEFGAVDVGSKFSNLDINFSKELGGLWVDILARSYQDASVLEIKVDCPRYVSKEALMANPFVKSDDAFSGGSFGKVISGRKCIICESVSSEFKELVLMCGGVNEKLRADQLLQRMVVVPDSPSTRMMSLPTTRKLALKNKIVFGTGDYWHAPTLTANMGFVRAVLQTGMSLFTFEHRPRALIGD
nr:hypothetical protein [Tanacetum cinerariifolium]